MYWFLLILGCQACTKSLNTYVANINSSYVGFLIILRSYVCRILNLYQVLMYVCKIYWLLMSTIFCQYWIPTYVGYKNPFQTGILCSKKAVHLLQRRCRRIPQASRENLSLNIDQICVCEYVSESVPMQITLGVLVIIVEVSWLLDYWGQFDYFVLPQECSHILCAHNLFSPAWYIDSYLYWDVKLVPSL